MRPGLKCLQQVTNKDIKADTLSYYRDPISTEKFNNNNDNSGDTISSLKFKDKQEDKQEDKSLNMVETVSDKKENTPTFIPLKREHKLSESSSLDRASDDEENVDGKPNHSYISLIANAILSSPEKRLVLSDIYNYVLEHYSYFRNKGPGWRNSIRHNLSLNECFIKAGRSPNGKGHYWAINQANYDDFSKGDFRRRRAQRRARRAIAYGDIPEQVYPSYWSYHPYLSVNRPHSLQSSYPTSPSSYRLSPYYPSTSPTYHSTCKSPTCSIPQMRDVKIERVTENVRKSKKRGFDVESLLRDDDDKPAAKLLKRPSSIEISPPLPPTLPPSITPYRPTNEHFAFPEKRASLSPSYHNSRYSDIPIPSPSSVLLSFDRYRNWIASTPSKSHILQNDHMRMSLVQ